MARFDWMFTIPVLLLLLLVAAFLPAAAIDCVAGIVQRNYTEGCSCENGAGGENDCQMDQWCKLNENGALPGRCVPQCELDRNPAECVCGTTLMAELCSPSDMCMGEDIKCSNLGDEPRRECRNAGRKKYMQGIDRVDWPTGDCLEHLARDDTEDGICAPARQCVTRCVFSGEDSGHCTSYAKAETLAALICDQYTTEEECDQKSGLDLASSPGKGEKWAGTFCCPVFEAIDGSYPACTWPRNARYPDGGYMSHGPFDKCSGKRAPLPESAGTMLSYLVEPALAKIWCGDLESEADCKAKHPCVWQYKEMTCKKSTAPDFWDRGGVFVMADPEGACEYPGCWGEDAKR